MARRSDFVFGLIVTVIVLATTGSVSTAQQAPFVQTGSATGVSSSAATLTGTATPNGSETLAFFEYGTTSALGSRTAEQPLGSGFIGVAVSTPLSGLQANTTYYFRLVARNAGSFGNLPGNSNTFFTAGTATGNPPGVATNAATDITATAAVLRAYVAAGDQPAAVWFEYGPRADVLPYTTPQVPVADISYYRTTGTSPFVSAPISSLIPGIGYAFRAVVRSAEGIVNYGTTLGFYTLLGPNPNTVSYASYYYQQYQPYQQTYQAPLSVVNVPTYTPPPSGAVAAPGGQKSPRVAEATPAKSYYYRIPSYAPAPAVASSQGRRNTQAASIAETVSGGSMFGNVIFGIIFAFLVFMIATYTWRIFRLASYGV